MLLAIAMTVGFLFLVWLIFFKLKLLKFSIMWGILCAFFFLHILLIFLIGLRCVTPYSTDAKVIQHTIQLIPRLPEPTLVTGVLVETNVPVKKGQPLFQFDRRPYEYKVNAVKAQLAAAEQKVLELKAQLDAASSAVAQAKAQRAVLKEGLDAAASSVVEARAKRNLAQSTFHIAENLRSRDSGDAISKLRYDETRQGLAEADAAVQVALANTAKARVAYQQEAEAAILIAVANEERARLAYTSQINGENTTVAALKADLAQALYYLENTTMEAPADGYIINLQVREGMVAGIFRMGAIASFIVDADRYVLATYSQETLKYVKNGQPVEVALDRYPGQIFAGKVKSIWQGSGEGQLLPSGDLPKFNPAPPNAPQGCFAVQIVLDAEDQSQFPIGTQGAAAIYTSDGAWAALRRIAIRGRTWMNWLYPLPF
jgi:multidrug resistance efflux pump